MRSGKAADGSKAQCMPISPVMKVTVHGTWLVNMVIEYANMLTKWLCIYMSIYIYMVLGFFLSSDDW